MIQSILKALSHRAVGLGVLDHFPLQTLVLKTDKMTMGRRWFGTLKLALSSAAMVAVLLLNAGCENSDNHVVGEISDTWNRSTLQANDLSITINEGSTSSILIVLDHPIKQDADLNWSIAGLSGGEATGIFSSTNGVLRFKRGEQSKMIQIESVQNTIRQGNVGFTLSLEGTWIVFTNTLTINVMVSDDESPPVLSIANASVTEGTGAGTSLMNFTVTASHASSSAITVNDATSNGTAMAGLDYTTTTGVLTIPGGSLTGTISVPVIHDSLTEGSEAFNINLSGGDGYTVAGSTLAAVGTIFDDEGTPTISIADVSIAEGTGAGSTTATLTITSSGLSSTPITVDYTTLLTGTATVGTDFSSTMGLATIAAGALSTTFTIPITRDALDENDETINVQLSGGSGYQSFGSTFNSVVTIVDDDGAPTISIANVSVTEGNSGSSNLVFTLTASAASGLPISVNYATSNGTATAGADYTATSGTATIAAGSTTQTISVPVSGDALYENDETLTMTLSSGSGYTVAGSTLTATGTITNDDTAPTISIASVTTAEGNSGSSTMTFTVTASGTSNLPISFNYATSNGTATTGSDYVAASGTATIAAGTTTTTIDVTVSGDTLYEASETLTMTLSGGSGYTVAGSTLTTTGTITNDDTAPTISIANVSQAEGNSGSLNMIFTVTASTASGLPITVNYATSNGSATAGTDYTATSGTATIAAGATTTTISVPVLGDTTYENDETFTLTLSGGSGYTSAGSALSATGTITNDDTAPTISIANSSVTEGNSGTSTMTFTVTASSASGLPIAFNYASSAVTATAVSDYTAVNSSGTISAGSTSTTFTVSVNGDTLYENDETFTVTLSSGFGYTSAGSTLSATGTITNDDTAPTLSIGNVSVTEGTGAGTTSAVFTITASTSSGADVTVNYATSNGTAMAGSDYTATSGTATIAAGATTTTFTVPVLRDGTYESTKTYTVTLSAGAGYTSAGSTLTATGTILDDDLISMTWDFATPANYTYDTNYITMSGTTASLKTVNTTFNDATTFNSGTHVGTSYSGGKLALTTTGGSEMNSMWTPQWSSLVGYWRFNNDTSDFTGLNANGSVSGNASYASSPFSQAFVFDGATRVSSTNSTSLNVTNLYSVSFWVKPNSIGVSNQMLISKDANGIEIYLNIDGKIYLSTSNIANLASTNSVLTAGKWYHVTLTRNGSAIKIYLNGIESTSILSTSVPAGNTQPLQFGGKSNGQYFAGSLDEVAIWSKELTPAQVDTIYYKQAHVYQNELSPTWTPKWSSLVGYWKMDGNWLDSSGNGRNGIGAGGATFTTQAKVGASAAVFDGADDFSSISHHSSLNLNGSYSISIWVKPQNWPAYAGLLTKGDGNNDGWFIWIENQNLRFTRPGYTRTVVVNNLIWNHVVYSFDSSTGLLAVYKDGILQSKMAFTNGGATSTTALELGRVYSNSTYSSASHIDDFAIWNAALTRNEVEVIYNRQKQKYAGSYHSPIVDMGASGATWTTLSGITSLPFFKEISTSVESSYSGLTGILSTGLVGYWKLESNSNAVAGPNLGVAGSGISYSTASKVLGGAALSLSGAGAIGASPSSTFAFPNTTFTTSTWLRTSSTNGNNYFLANGGSGAGWALRITPNVGIMLKNAANGQIYLNNSEMLNDGKWHHIVAVITTNTTTEVANTATIYVDGKSTTVYQSLPGNGAYNDPTASFGLSIGARAFNGTGSNYFDGLIDEVAVWNRALSPTEVLELYRRGANRVKYQARSCVESTCACKQINTSPVGTASDCSGNGTADDLLGTDPLQANWIGPDGTASTYFSELQNNSSVDSSGNPTGTVNTTGLNLDWSGSFFTPAARPTANRYFQFRVYLESDDENNLCSGAPCMPEVTSIAIGPTNRYYGGSPTVVNNTAQAYSSLQTMTRSDTGSCTKYQVSTDGGSTWKYWNGSAWATASSSANSNYLSDYSGNLSALSSGNFKFKAFLNTNTSGDFTQTCTLNSVGIGYTP